MHGESRSQGSTGLCPGCARLLVFAGDCTGNIDSGARLGRHHHQGLVLLIALPWTLPARRLGSSKGHMQGLSLLQRSAPGCKEATGLGFGGRTLTCSPQLLWGIALVERNLKQKKILCSASDFDTGSKSVCSSRRPLVSLHC